MDAISKLRALGIDVSSNHDRNVKVKCPNCTPHDRKPKNRNAKDLSVNVQEGWYKCHNCGWKGSVEDKYEHTEVKNYSLPDESILLDMSNAAQKYLMDRGISRRVIMENGVSMDKFGNVVFPYRMNGTLVNTKSRSLTKKDFRQSANARPIVFNYDRAMAALKSMTNGEKTLILTEGEIDSMSWEEAGFLATVSVNQGAPNKNDSNYDNKLRCIDESIEIFEEADFIVLSADNDENGEVMNEYIIRRFGAEKCLRIDFGDWKDANEILCNLGKDKLIKIYENRKEIKLDGVFYLDDVRDSMMRDFYHGKQRGTTTYTDLDAAWTWMPGEVNLWTGYNNEGKSFMLQYLAVLKAFHEGKKFGFFTPENMPMNNFFDELIEIYIGKSCDRHYENHPEIQVMSREEYEMGMDFISRHFFCVYPPKDFKLDTLFEMAEYLIRKQNIFGFVIDPYNWVEHRMRPGEREDLYISRFMTKLGNFSKERQLSMHLVAHQTTPSKGTDGLYPCPSKYGVKGGGTFSDKTDNVLGVWRPRYAMDKFDTEVVFFSEKIKKQKLVGLPQRIGAEFCGIDIRFNRPKNRYTFNGNDPFEEVDIIRMNKEHEKKVGIQPNLSFEEEEDDPF